MKAINSQIKKLRKSFPNTQEEMAEKLNLSVSAYKNIENGITKLDIDRLKEICEVLGTNLTELINLADNLYIEQILTNKGAINANEFHLHDADIVKELYEKLLLQKDEIIQAKDNLITSLKNEIRLLKKGN